MSGRAPSLVLHTGVRAALVHWLLQCLAEQRSTAPEPSNRVVVIFLQSGLFERYGVVRLWSTARVHPFVAPTYHSSRMRWRSRPRVLHSGRSCRYAERVHGEAAAPLLMGATLNDRYRVIGPISAGAMGAVYRAEDLRCGGEVAVKQLGHHGHAGRFAAEARILAGLDHPRLPRYIEEFEDETGVYLVMEFVRGEDLGRILKQRGRSGVPLADAVGWVGEACEALQYLHEQGVIHRDVKLQNMILGERGVVLVDLGVAHLIGQDEEFATVGIGTPRYMAPEVFAGGLSSARADVFGVAATLWTLLAGRPPVYGDPVRLSELAPEVSPDLEALISAGVEMIPERRVSSIAAFATGLDRCMGLDRYAGLGLTRPFAFPSDVVRGSARLMETIARAAVRALDAVAVSICLVDDLAGEYVCRAAAGAGAIEIVGTRLSIGIGVAGMVIATGVGDAVEDLAHDPRYSEDMGLFRAAGYIPTVMVVVPLMTSRGPAGALSVLDSRTEPSHGPQDLDRVSGFAEIAVEALELFSRFASGRG